MDITDWLTVMWIDTAVLRDMEIGIRKEGGQRRRWKMVHEWFGAHKNTVSEETNHLQVVHIRCVRPPASLVFTFILTSTYYVYAWLGPKALQKWIPGLICFFWQHFIMYINLFSVWIYYFPMFILQKMFSPFLRTFFSIGSITLTDLNKCFNVTSNWRNNGGDDIIFSDVELYLCSLR